MPVYQEPKGVVHLNVQESKLFFFEKSVTQGDNLSPLFFIMFIDEIPILAQAFVGRYHHLSQSKG